MGMFIPDEYTNNNSNNNNNYNNTIISNDYNNSNNTIISNDYNNSNNTFINNMDNNNMGNINNTFIPIDYSLNNDNNNNSENSINNINPIPVPENNPFASIRQNSERINSDKTNTMFMNNIEDNNVSNNSNDLLPNLDNKFESTMDFTNLDQSFNLDDYKIPEENNYNIDNNINNDNINNDNINNNYNNNINSEPLEIGSLDDVLNTIKAAVDKVKNGKIKVETDEIDFDDLYQVTIKVSKLGDY